MQIATYLNFDGNCEEAFRFYERLLGGKIEFILSHGDSPIADQVPEAWHPRVMHARLAVGDQLLLASDCPPESYEPPRGIFVMLNVDDATEAERVFRGLEEGGRATTPFGETFWADRFGMVVDRFGIPWMVNYAGSKAAVDVGRPA
ncbi:MAG TPA: VOC family protein [Gemmatimonadales bacterium]|nr:VOC family protein [Gemmatimonadales bacterium]